MKNLKPGKVEQRKFVCNKCGCVFVAKPADIVSAPFDDDEEWMCCPDCGYQQLWDNGEPTQSDMERLNDIIREWNWWSNGTCGFAQYLLDNGVTFREG